MLEKTSKMLALGETFDSSTHKNEHVYYDKPIPFNKHHCELKKHDDTEENMKIVQHDLEPNS